MDTYVFYRYNILSSYQRVRMTTPSTTSDVTSSNTLENTDFVLIDSKDVISTQLTAVGMSLASKCYLFVAGHISELIKYYTAIGIKNIIAKPLAKNVAIYLFPTTTTGITICLDLIGVISHLRYIRSLQEYSKDIPLIDLNVNNTCKPKKSAIKRVARDVEVIYHLIEIASHVASMYGYTLREDAKCSRTLLMALNGIGAIIQSKNVAADMIRGSYLGSAIGCMDVSAHLAGFTYDAGCMYIESYFK